MCMKNGKMYSCQEKENKNRCLIESDQAEFKRNRN